MVEHCWSLEVIACHYDASSGELLPTDPVSTVPGAAVGLEGQTFAAAIRISGWGQVAGDNAVEDDFCWWFPGIGGK